MASNRNERLLYISQFGSFSSISPLLLNLIDCNEHCTEANVHRISKNGSVLFRFLSTRRQCLFCVERYAKLNNKILGNISILFERYLWAHTSIPYIWSKTHRFFFSFFTVVKEFWTPVLVKLSRTCYSICIYVRRWVYIAWAHFEWKYFDIFKFSWSHTSNAIAVLLLCLFCCWCHCLTEWTLKRNMAIYFNFMKEHWWWETM